MALKGRRFSTVETIKTETKIILRTITKSDFGSCFEKWKRIWLKCIDAEGAYILRNIKYILIRCIFYMEF